MIVAGTLMRVKIIIIMKLKELFYQLERLYKKYNIQEGGSKKTMNLALGNVFYTR